MHKIESFPYKKLKNYVVGGVPLPGPTPLETGTLLPSSTLLPPEEKNSCRLSSSHSSVIYYAQTVVVHKSATFRPISIIMWTDFNNSFTVAFVDSRKPVTRTSIYRTYSVSRNNPLRFSDIFFPNG